MLLRLLTLLTLLLITLTTDYRRKSTPAAAELLAVIATIFKRTPSNC